MKILKRMIFALLALLPLANGMAFADNEHDYSRIFIFGASFMDSGNRFAVTGETAHPPFEPMAVVSYGVGGHRPTNGPTWVEVLAQEMGLNKWGKPAYRDPAFGNYAYAHGRAREVANPTGYSLGTQVADWMANGYCTYVPMEDTLFVVDSGYADLLDIMAVMPDLAAAFGIMEKMAESIAENIDMLYECGARNLLFAYLGPMEYAPVSNRGLPPGQIQPFLSWTYNNNYLTPIVVGPNLERMNFSTVNFFMFIGGIMAMPEFYGFTNVTDSCVTPLVVENAFCKDRNEHFWWDALHPTKKVHALLAEFALGQLPVPE